MGHAVFEPNTAPANNNQPVQVGDVGFFDGSGMFIRLFNICLAREDPHQAEEVPEDFQPLDEHERQTYPLAPLHEENTPDSM